MAVPYNQNLDTLDCMIDIETLDTEDTAVILSIGAILFNPFTDEPLIDDEGTILCPHYYSVLHKETQRGRTISRSTEDFWNHPDRAEAKKQLDDYENKKHLVVALDELWDFMKGKHGDNKKRVVKGWGCAPSFDQKIIGHAMENTGVAKFKGSSQRLPIAFWNEMDVRSIENFVFGTKFRSDNRKGTYHNALDDCITQAVMTREAWKIVKAGIEATQGASS